APRPHPRGAEDPLGNGVHFAEIVDQPAVGAEHSERVRERGEVEAVEQRRSHQWWRGSGGAARHSHASPPVARHETWSMAPSNPTSSRSSSVNRSEEHTSELQSLRHLVCRLLLEKK